MHRLSRRFAGAAGVLAALAAFSGVARGDGPSTAPGEGVLCMWGFISVAAEVGDRCFPGQDSAFQAQLHDLVGRMDAYVMKNQPASAGGIADFHRRQGMAGAPASTLCQGDPMVLYKGLRDLGADKVRSQVEALISRPGKPSWGGCV